jgi:hypothetical protein
MRYLTLAELVELHRRVLKATGVKSQRCWITETATHSMWREST